MHKLIVTAALALAAIGCNENDRARSWGGTMKVQLPSETKFVNATWKGSELWYIYRTAIPGDVANNVVMKQDTGYHFASGEVHFVETITLVAPPTEPDVLRVTEHILERVLEKVPDAKEKR